jgi:hypothetical protein
VVVVQEEVEVEGKIEAVIVAQEEELVPDAVDDNLFGPVCNISAVIIPIISQFIKSIMNCSGNSSPKHST